MTELRELAFELSQLPALQREALLRELPEEPRARMTTLLGDIDRALQGPSRQSTDFEDHLVSAERESRSLALLNDGQLRLLVASEHPELQERIVASVRRPANTVFAPAVARVVADHIARKLEVRRVLGDETPQRENFWRRISWWRR